MTVASELRKILESRDVVIAPPVHTRCAIRSDTRMIVEPGEEAPERGVLHMADILANTIKGKAVTFGRVPLPRAAESAEYETDGGVIVRRVRVYLSASDQESIRWDITFE